MNVVRLARPRLVGGVFSGRCRFATSWNNDGGHQHRDSSFTAPIECLSEGLLHTSHHSAGSKKLQYKVLERAGQKYMDLRLYDQVENEDGSSFFPASKKGITLPAEQFDCLVDVMPLLQDNVAKVMASLPAPAQAAPAASQDFRALKTRQFHPTPKTGQRSEGSVGDSLLKYTVSTRVDCTTRYVDIRRWEIVGAPGGKTFASASPDGISMRYEQLEALVAALPALRQAIAQAGEST